ncbi:hypothetical protein AOL_s00083g403 [Orbilia oligospora ATCC 24927]|uniref:Protection of telomeres protein 1 n=1 Tax=Arthrobotrys oligospora (strain ATCC 24927 / CBS 115.81 / DSM 1491) TaxID=756982 RepID=G1XHC2_ARTOA|nr:hypothetical protein AOL_s00083g403 [Orbilia oligospora ATCC 24927]EGX47467.1 hypothetical protein AOL_s00083g403 [Orbilia oligospora ATCC 24927]
MSLKAQYASVTEAKAKIDQFVDLIGISVGFKAPKQSYGTDFQATIELCDKSATVYENRLTVRIFRPDAESLPQEMDIGETIVVFKHIKVVALKNQGNALVGMTNKTRSSWVICKADIPSKRKSAGGQNKRNDRIRIRIVDNGPYRVQDPEKKKDLLSEEEYDACRDIFEFFHTRGGLAGCHGMTERDYNEDVKPQQEVLKKAALIKEIQLDHFYDLTCFVQHVWSHNRFVEITVTDFTENKSLCPRGIDPFSDEMEPTVRNETESYMLEGAGVTRNPKKSANKKWFEKPFGFYSLKIACWDSWAQKANSEITEGCYLALTNVLIKRGKSGQWEGSISDGKKARSFRDGFKVLRPENPALKPLHNRKKELLRLVAQNENERSVRERKLKEEKAQAKLAAELKKRQENNPQVHCGYISVETTTLGKILRMLDGDDVDFFNRRYRTECRVVDFRPSDIRDFARRINGDTGACAVDLEASMGTESGHAKHPPEWYWCFELDVVGKEDDAMITIHVDDAGGRYLLTPEPCDFRADANRYKYDELKNELFHLWGNLEEAKTRRRERIEVLENHVRSLINQYNSGKHDQRFLEQRYRILAAQRQEIQGRPIIMDPTVSNKFFFAIIKEYGEDDEDGVPERKFILENTSVSRGLVTRERQKALDRARKRALADSDQGSIQVPEGVDLMVLDE